jgi:hypothetical protein
MFLFNLGIIIVALCVIISAIGYTIMLPGYSRKKMLEGYPVRNQMYVRHRIGRSIRDAGLVSVVATSFLAFVIIGLFHPVETVEIAPKKVHILAAQSKTMVIADGEVFFLDGAHYHIKRVYITKNLNMYGATCPDSRKLVIEDQDQWEVTGR